VYYILDTFCRIYSLYSKSYLSEYDCLFQDYNSQCSDAGGINWSYWTDETRKIKTNFDSISQCSVRRDSLMHLTFVTCASIWAHGLNFLTNLQWRWPFVLFWKYK